MIEFYLFGIVFTKAENATIVIIVSTITPQGVMGSVSVVERAPL